MMYRKRRFHYLIIAVVVCVLAYDLLTKKDNGRGLSTRRRRERELVIWDRGTSTRETKHRKQKHRNRDGREQVIASLREEVEKLLERIAKLNKTCVPPVPVSKKREKDTKRIRRNIRDKKEAKQKFLFRQSKHIIFRSFSRSSVYQANVQSSPSVRFTDANIGNSGAYKHLDVALQRAMKMLRKSLNLSVDADIVLKRGLFLEDSNFGIEYEFHFTIGKSLSTYSVTLRRLYSRLISVQKPALISSSEELINFIVPLAGRLDRFEKFLQNFIKVCVSKKENVFLTVVYNGKDAGISQAKLLLKNSLEKRHGFRNFLFIPRIHEFSRGRALHDGVTRWKGDSNVLMFFCDVDVTFDSGFLERCRSFTQPHRKVYYPIVFNLYNPKYVARTATQFLRISSKIGHWRYYGFGMTCQYRNDYLKVGGFDLDIKGWGSEDIMLYQNYIRQENIRVIRAPDSGLFHHYHAKKCDKTLPRGQLHDCIKSKISTEASQLQYGMRVLELEQQSASRERGSKT